LRSLVEGLSANERKLLLALQKPGEGVNVEAAAKEAGIDQSAVMRAGLSLAEKGFIGITEFDRSYISLTGEGEIYAREGMPERRMLTALAQRGPETLEGVATMAAIPRELTQIALGWMKRKGWVEITKEVGRVKLDISKSGEDALGQKLADEILLEKLAGARKTSLEELPEELKRVVEQLRGRKLVEIEEKLARKLTLTDLGKRALALGVELIEEVKELAHELLVSGRWREVKFRRYDVVAPGAPVYPGKVHPQQQVIDELREILLEMGFVEIKSNLVESEFWNFDALFQAQDHPAREIHDSLSLSKPERTRLPSPALVGRVAAAHERGVAGSTGWGYKFNVDISRRPVLCSQTTAATVRYLASHPEPPAKIFSINRVYRHEKIDYKHLAEFYQAEGIVMDPKLTLRDMLGYLKQIMVKLGLPKIRFRPGMFPFTEPSVEADVYHEGMREWIEILGAGLFRPEVLRPLDIRYPVLAWGIGLTRLIAIRLGLKDIRDIFCNDLNWISRFVYPPLSTKLGTQILVADR
jgi:phenylalanyl-tRNA synthetase alpha chain